MTVIDDDLLADLFARAGDSFEVPVTGATEILERAFPRAGTGQGDGDGDGDGDGAAAEGGAGGLVAAADELAARRARRIRTALGTHRLLTVAACLVVLLAASAGVTWLGRSSPPSQVAASRALSPATARSRHGNSATVPTTTVPGAGTGAGQPGFSVSGGSTGTSSSAQLNKAAAAPPAEAAPSSTATGSAPTTVPSGTGSSGLPGEVGQSSKVEQTGSLSLAVPKGALARTMTELTALAGFFNGFVANSQTQLGQGVGNEPNGSITLQVPVASFADVVKKAQTYGKTSDLTTKATDVTGQYVDLQARITALQDSRQQYLTIMSRATSIGDVLSVQAQLDDLQSQIEQLQGQLQVLDSETTYSTLTVTVNEARVPVHHVVAHHRSGLAKAWHDSVHGFIDGVDGLIAGAGPVLFALLCAGIVIFGGRLLWRRYQRHNL